LQFRSKSLHTHLAILYAHKIQSACNIFQRFKVICITVMPPGDFVVLKNVHAITQQITPFKLK